MMKCVNIKNPQFLQLLEATKLPSIVLEVKISKWQEDNNSDEFPTSEQVLESGEINYALKAINILESDKAKQIFEKGNKANWDLNKILTELQIPKDQKALLLDLNITDREELVLQLASNYSYSIKIDITKSRDSVKYTNYGDIEELDSPNYEEERNTSYYSNLTVPGGTNYTENEISTPLITPSIKGHAQFSTNNGIGWHRVDERIINIQKMLELGLIKEVPCN